MEMNELLSAPIVLAIVLATVALLAVFLIANGIAAWYDERSRRAVAVVRSGGQLPAAGLGTFHGVAHNFDARSGGELVRREQTQVSSQVATGLAWQDRGCVVTARPFLLVLESGVEIEIDAREPRLVGFPETSSGAYTNAPFEPPRRELTSRVSAGDEIWVTGVLARPSDNNAGAYRSSVARRKLRAPRRGALEIARESPVARWTTYAAAHKRGAYAALGALALLHGVFFRTVDKHLLAGPASFRWEAMGAVHRTWPLVIVPAALGVMIVMGVWFFGIRRAWEQHRS
ncbi:MAG: hypothetical protein ABI134_24800 [Byssovorax sp.]